MRYMLVLLLASLLVAPSTTAQQSIPECDLSLVAAAIDAASEVIDGGDQVAALSALAELESLIATTRSECATLTASNEGDELPPVLHNDKLLHDDSLITGEPCDAPCWRGITPGETSWREALTILEDESDLMLDPVQDAPDSDAIGVQWKQEEGELCCLMISEDGAIVSAISLQTAPDMTVGEVFEIHDEPTYALGGEVTEDQAIVNLIYPDVPMVLVAFVPGKTGEITRSSEIIAVSYLTPANMELAIQTNNLHIWEGYQPFSVYAADAEASEFEVTPSITLVPVNNQ